MLLGVSSGDSKYLCQLVPVLIIGEKMLEIHKSHLLLQQRWLSPSLKPGIVRKSQYLRTHLKHHPFLSPREMCLNTKAQSHSSSPRHLMITRCKLWRGFDLKTRHRHLYVETTITKARSWQLVFTISLKMIYNFYTPPSLREGLIIHFTTATVRKFEFCN